MPLFFLYAARTGQNADPARSEDFLTSLLSMLIVFAGLAVVLALARLVSAVRSGSRRRVLQPSKTPAVPKPAPATPIGGSDEVKLYTVPDKTAALLMAIVADEMNVPLHELRFLSIREM